jgi:hypothetical protein
LLKFSNYDKERHGMKVRIGIQGTSPLLMHNVRLANPLDPIAKAIKVISGKRRKTEDDFEQLARLEFEGGLYLSPTVGPYVPGVNIEKSIVQGARITKQGRQVERGLFVTDDEPPLLYSGPRTVDELWADENFRSTLACKVGTAMIMRTRPVFRSWAVEAEAQVDPGLLDIANLQAVIDDAGSMVGIGDYRPRYGRFTATVEVL